MFTLPAVSTDTPVSALHDVSVLSAHLLFFLICLIYASDESDVSAYFLSMNQWINLLSYVS
jgi:hypothetical protein